MGHTYLHFLLNFPQLSYLHLHWVWTPWLQGLCALFLCTLNTAVGKNFCNKYSQNSIWKFTSTFHSLAQQSSNKIVHDSLDSILKKVLIHILGFYSKLNGSIICHWSGSDHTRNIITDSCYPTPSYLPEYKSQDQQVLKLITCCIKSKHTETSW